MSDTNRDVPGASNPSGPGPVRPAPPRVAGPTAQVIALGELDPAGGDGASGGGALLDALANVRHPLRKVKATLTVNVGTAEVSLGELLAAREQHVIPLDRKVDQPVDVLLEGHVVARGTLVAVDDHFAVRITELSESFDAATGGALAD
jgi:flagellar motor switch protein FliN/FliY